MGFQKGRQKTGGRVKGTKNKLNMGVVEALEQRGIDCVEEMLKIAEQTEKEDIRLTVYKELLKYVYPQRKAVEVDSATGGFVVNINNKAVDVERD